MVLVVLSLARAEAPLVAVDLMVKAVNLAVKVVSLVVVAVVLVALLVEMVVLEEQELSGVLVDLSQTTQHKISPV